MLKDDRAALSRRQFVGKVATGAAGAAVAVSVVSSSADATAHHETKSGAFADDPAQPQGERAETTESQSKVSSPAPWELLQPLRQGSSLAEGWTVQELSDIADGSCVLTLENERGRSHRVHICRNDGSPEGLVFTDRLDLVVMNGGRGDLPTEESFGRAVAEVAHVLATNEKGAGPVIAELLPQKQRLAMFADTARLR